MNKTVRLLLGSSLLCAALFTLAAQDGVPAPPKLLRIIREDIKEGRAAAHEKTEAKWSQLLSRLKYPANSLAMTAMSGPPQVLFLEAHATFTSIGDTDGFVERSPSSKSQFEALDTQDAESRSSSRTWIAVYHPEMSYKAAQLVTTLPKTRYFNVTTFRVRPGHDQEFGDLAKSAVAALDKSSSDQPVATYQIVSGAPNGTYLLFEPSASLKSLDDGEARGRAMYQAMGDSGMKKFIKSAGEAIASSESVLFVINPKMSYPPKAVVDADPEFWSPKPAKSAAPKPAAK